MLSSSSWRIAEDYLVKRLAIPLFVTVMLTTNAAADDAPLDAIVRIEARGQTEKGPYVRIGTGFLVGQKDADYVLTARHLVFPDSAPVNDDVTGRPRFTIYIELRDERGILKDRREASVFRENAHWDVALLSFDGTKRRGLQTCPEQDLSGPINMVARGFPVRLDAGVDKSDGDVLENTNGLLSERRQADGGRYRFSAPTRAGFSGAPVFVGGRLVGLLTGGTDGRLTTSAQSMFSPLKAVRGIALGKCAPKCRHKEHGLEGYAESEAWVVESGLLPSPLSAPEYCKARQEERSRIAPQRKIVAREMEERIVLRETSAAGERLYQYRCVFQEQWKEVYQEAESTHCDPEQAGGLPH
jgi:hypothetical protein